MPVTNGKEKGTIMKKTELMEHHENSGNEEQADMYQAVHAVWAHIA